MAALAAGGAGRQQFVDRFSNQTSAPWVSKQVVDRIHDARRPEAAASHCLTVKDRDGHPPGALPGNAPVRAVFDHAVDSLPAPVGNPVTWSMAARDCCRRPGFFHGDKPLGGGPENHRLLAAPAVGIGVGDLLFASRAPFSLELGTDVPVGLEDELSWKNSTSSVKQPRSSTGE